MSQNGEEPTKKQKVEETDSLSQIKKFTNIVADTGEFTQIEKYSPEDATTNPSLILQAANKPEYKELFDQAILYGKQNFSKLKEEPVRRSSSRSTRGSARKSVKKDTEEEPVQEQKPFNYTELSSEDQTLLLNLIVDKLCVLFGKKILEIVPGVVSTEVDARLSYDKQGTEQRAKRIIQLYEEEGISKDRILIKIAATWEGIQAGKALKKDKIKTNMTLIFGYGQAIACAEAGVHLISPFVGRILDWHKKQNPSKSDADFARHNCPGVQSVSSIYNYYKKYEYATIVMGASFRNIGQIIELAGCDKLTISPKLLQELQDNKEETVKELLNVEAAKDLDIPKISVDEKTFRWMQCQDSCQSELLPSGIKKFAQDIEKLEGLIKDALTANPTIEEDNKEEAEKIQEE